MAVLKMEHVGVMVANLEASIRFYEEVIGLKHKGTLLHTNGVIRLAFLGFETLNETEVELIEGYNAGLPQEGKVHHLAFTVDDVEAEFTRIQGLDVQQIDEEITTLPNGSRYFFFNGLDGERIEFFQTTR
ncbi:VOC family protein [Paenibacillus sp. CGMCC 1.16610]|uniref:VOC family protein n=1 Tax=Paenibacillus anseongense TaxID=2682845 RepID=A0ABW9UII1_9BACL|nr:MULTISPECIES: VOC family protein [Paenibacillus]MBA2943527.1 VOC family protein [Paenibacillus sp. CGMCC 1.16610]MVQ39678.1 VOC family protein [Paenibacillus anseongense]